MSEPNDTAPAAETERAEPTSMTDILDRRDTHEGTAAHEGEHEVGTEPAPALAAATTAKPAPKAETAPDPAEKPEREQPFWYRKEIEKERKARQAAEARAAAAERRPAPQQQDRPAEDDPERPLTRAELEFYRNQDALFGRLERSEERFVDKLGEETFEETKAWLTTRPDIEEWALKQRDPWRAAHSQYAKEKIASEIGEDPEAWKTAERERIRQEILAEQSDNDQHTPASRPAPQMRSAPPAPASTARSAAPERDRSGKFAGPTPISAIVGKRRG